MKPEEIELKPNEVLLKVYNCAFRIDWHKYDKKLHAYCRIIFCGKDVSNKDYNQKFIDIYFSHGDRIDNRYIITTVK